MLFSVGAIGFPHKEAQSNNHYLAFLEFARSLLAYSIELLYSKFCLRGPQFGENVLGISYPNVFSTYSG